MWRIVVCIVLSLAVDTIAYSQSFSKFRSPSSRRDGELDQSPVPRTDDPRLLLGDFQVVPGVPFLRAAISSQAHSQKLVSVSKGGTNGVRNYVFLNTETDVATTLLQDNQSLIISLMPLSESKEQEHSKSSGSPIELINVEERYDRSNQFDSVVAHLAVVVTTDSDKDGKLTADDQQSLGIADAGGRGFTEIIPDLGHIFAKTMLNKLTLLVIHGSQAKQFAVRIDVEKRTLVSTKLVPNFGTR